MRKLERRRKHSSPLCSLRHARSSSVSPRIRARIPATTFRTPRDQLLLFPAPTAFVARGHTLELDVPMRFPLQMAQRVRSPTNEVRLRCVANHQVVVLERTHHSGRQIHVTTERV